MSAELKPELREALIELAEAIGHASELLDTVVTLMVGDDFRDEFDTLRGVEST